jgi:cytochrome c556
MVGGDSTAWQDEMRMRFHAALGGMIIVLAAAAQAAAAPDQDVLARQSAMKAMGKTFKEIHGVGAGDVDAKRGMLISDAAQLKLEASKPWGYFGPETANSAMKTEALPAIWTDTAGFKADQDRLANAVAALDAAAASGAPDLVEAKIGDVGAACGVCHKAFKAK